MTISTSKNIVNSSLTSAKTNEEFEHNENSLNNIKSINKINESSLYKKIKLSLNFDSRERQEKINNIKAKVHSGSYYINPSDIAVSMLRDLLKNIE
jgi:anti-sigma28 factor (negative regulator of flagellin synthesis)